MTRAPSTLDDINRLGIAFAEAKIVLAAIELGLFTHLGLRRRIPRARQPDDVSRVDEPHRADPDR